MRVIAGEYKGRNLEAPSGLDVRPTGDKIKGAIFNMLSDRIIDARVMDLFAGSGNLGIEALSRGASSCYFFDNSAKSISAIKENLSHITSGNSSKKAIESSVVEQSDFRIALRRYSGAAVDVVFVDPPYEAGYYEEIMQLLDRYDIIMRGGLVFLESTTNILLEDSIDGFSKIKEKKYGKTMITVYERELE